MRWPDPDLILNEISYYNIQVVAKMANRSVQTIRLWYKWSQAEEEKGRDRLIPDPIIYKNKYLWSRHDINKISEFAKKVQYGQLSQYSRERWGNRGKNIMNDNSLEARNAKAEARRKIDQDAKNLQKTGERVVKKNQRSQLNNNLQEVANRIYSDPK